MCRSIQGSIGPRGGSDWSSTAANTAHHLDRRLAPCRPLAVPARRRSPPLPPAAAHTFAEALGDRAGEESSPSPASGSKAKLGEFAVVGGRVFILAIFEHRSTRTAIAYAAARARTAGARSLHRLTLRHGRERLPGVFETAERARRGLSQENTAGDVPRWIDVECNLGRTTQEEPVAGRR